MAIVKNKEAQETEQNEIELTGISVEDVVRMLDKAGKEGKEPHVEADFGHGTIKMVAIKPTSSKTVEIV
jgi:hypothetical protein